MKKTMAKKFKRPAAKPLGRRPGVVSEAHKALVAEMAALGYVEVAVAAARARVAASTVYGWIRAGRLNPRRVRRSVWVSEAELVPLTPSWAEVTAL